MITLGYKQEQKEQTAICEKLLRWEDIQDSNFQGNFSKEVKRIINHNVKSKERELRKKKNPWFGALEAYLCIWEKFQVEYLK